MIGCDCKVCTSTDKKDKRLRSSILIQSPNTNIVIDAGPDFRQQMLQYNVKKLDAVVITHAHKDHIAGLDDVRAYNFFQQKPMDVYGNTHTLNRIKAEFDYAFSEVKYAGVPSINLHTIDENVNFTIGDLTIIPIPVWHLHMPVLGFRLGDFTYITDANRIDAASKQKIKNSKILVLNALRTQKHISHFTLQEAIDLSNELEIPETFFIHMSHQIGTHEEVTQLLPKNKKLAFDGLKLNITNNC